jgi:hypothetical protein
MDSPTDEEIVAALLDCTPSRLIRILTPVLAARAESDAICSTKLVLCEYVTDGTITSAGGLDWAITLISAPSMPEEWSAFEGSGYWESGSCGRCRVEIGSYAKEVPCPLCGTSIELT